VTPRSLREHWSLDPAVTFLNHGSFGACPRPVLAVQREWRDRMEAEPVRFLDRELEAALDSARAPLASFLGTSPDQLAFVRNATTATNAVLASFAPTLGAGDEILLTDHEYNATLTAARRVADRVGARVVAAPIGLPVRGPEEVVEWILAAVTSRTRLAVISHVTSPSALVLPVASLVEALHERGVAVLIDGAHAPGMLELDLDTIGADWYAGNLHKWVCAPKGSGFLWTSPRRIATTRPVVTSHGANDPRRDRSGYLLEFDWTGTDDPTAWLSVPAALDFLDRLVPGGWPELRGSMHRLAVDGRRRLVDALGTDDLAPDDMLGSMAAVRVPIDARDSVAALELARGLQEEDRIEVPIADFPVRGARAEGAPPATWLLRISAAPYTTSADVDRLVAALGRRLGQQGR
jgi:isopenicillin-N epimerase